MQAEQARLEPLFRSVAIFFATGLGNWPLYALPFVIGAGMEGFGLSEVRAGLLGTVEIAAITLAALGCSRIIARVPYAAIAILGALLAATGHFASVFAGDFVGLIAARTIAGLGEGIALAAGSAAMSSVKEPDRLFAFVCIGRAAVSLVLVSLMGAVIEAFGSKSVFGLLAVVPVLSMPMLIMLPARSASPTTRQPTQFKAAPMRNFDVGVLLALGVALCCLLESLYWPFLERRGDAIGLATDQTAQLLAIAFFIGMFGALAPAALGARFGRRWPILLSVTGSALFALLAFGASSWLSFVISASAFGFLMNLAYPYCIGLAATLDDNGAWASISSTMLVAPFAAGPAISGLMVGAYGFGGLFWLLAACGLCASAVFAALFLRYASPSAPSATTVLNPD